MHHKYYRCAFSLLIVFLSLTFISMPLFHTGSWMSVIKAHIVLCATQNNVSQIAKYTYLTNDMASVIIELTDQQGWSIIEQDGKSYLLYKDNIYKIIIFDKHTFTGFDVIQISDDFNESYDNS